SLPAPAVADLYTRCPVGWGHRLLRPSDQPPAAHPVLPDGLSSAPAAGVPKAACLHRCAHLCGALPLHDSGCLDTGTGGPAAGALYLPCVADPDQIS